MVLKMDISIQALKNFDSGYNCAESVLLAVSANCSGLNPACIPMIATGFGGGIARNGSLCGALTGGIMALGLALGRRDNLASRDPCYPAVDALYGGFVERFGSSLCRDLIGADLKTPEGQQAHAQKEIKDICRNCVKWSAIQSLALIEGYAGGSSLPA